jgi:hypothetical protein
MRYYLYTCFDPTDFCRVIAQAVFDENTDRSPWIGDIEEKHKERLKAKGEDDFILRRCFDYSSTPIALNPSNEFETV